MTKACVKCGSPRGFKHKKFCVPCGIEERRITNRHSRQVAFDAGLCTSCKQPREAGRIERTCVACSEKWSARRHAWRAKQAAAGKCTNCDSQIANVGAVCEDCWFRRKSYRQVGIKWDHDIDWRALRGLFESQGRRCIYTGELLVPGKNASIDHKVPISRGGKHEIENLQWVSVRVNFMKTEMTHEEFIATCLRIVANVASGKPARELEYDGPETGRVNEAFKSTRPRKRRAA